MIITKRRVVSVDDVTAKLDALARRNHVAARCYEESAADSMSEFDALKWTSLCSQRRALLERESYNTVASSGEMPSPFRLVYGMPQRCAAAGSSIAVQLENQNGGLNDLAA
jgi:hypothetical protein